MPNELLDKVDKHDNILEGQITKQEAHDRRLLHRCAVIYVFSQDGRLYLQKHKKSGNRLDHSAGGHVQSGESYLEAAVREMYEELKIDAPLKEVVRSFLSKEERYNHMYGIYTSIANKEWAFHSNQEVDEVELLSVSEIKRRIESHPGDFTNGFRNTFKLLTGRDII